MRLILGACSAIFIVLLFGPFIDNELVIPAMSHHRVLAVVLSGVLVTATILICCFKKPTPSDTFWYFMATGSALALYFMR